MNAILETLKKHEDSCCGFRYQPADCSLDGYQSMDYEGDGETAGVWVFTSLASAIADLADQSSYFNMVLREGAKAVELVAVSYDAILAETSDDCTALVSGAKVVCRVDHDTIESMVGSAEEIAEEIE